MVPDWLSEFDELTLHLLASLDRTPVASPPGAAWSGSMPSRPGETGTSPKSPG
jgi:hypothetical protein